MALYDTLKLLNPNKGYEDVREGDSVASPGMEKPAEKPWDIRMTSVPVDGKEPFLNMTTRWNYLQSFLPLWKEALRFRSYAMVLAVVGVATLTTIPVVGIAALFGASYYHMLGEFRKANLTSGRKVMWAQ